MSLTPSINESVLALKSNRETIIAATTAKALLYKQEVAQHGDDAEQIISSGLEFTLMGLETAMLFGEKNLLLEQTSS